MTNLKNVEIIVDKMMNYLKHTTLENQSKKDILQKITELTERFAPELSTLSIDATLNSLG